MSFIIQRDHLVHSVQEVMKAVIYLEQQFLF